MKHTSKNQASKSQPINPKSKKPKGIKTVGWSDPQYPGFYFFKHENELRWTDLLLLRSHCVRKAYEVKCFAIAEDFAQWACLANIERIENGNTKNGHLNNLKWLWNEYINRTYGVKSPTGKKAQAYKNTISYDMVLDEDGTTRRDSLEDRNNPTPEQALEIKDTIKERFVLVANKTDELKKVVPIKNYQTSAVAVENLVYDFLANRNEYGFGVYNSNLLAEECAMLVRDFELAIGRLEKKAKLKIGKKEGFYYLPDEIHRLLKKPSEDTDEVA